MTNSRDLSHPRPRCSCGGELVIAGEVREGAYRTGFKLHCKKCGKHWTYTGGIYREDKGLCILSKCWGPCLTPFYKVTVQPYLFDLIMDEDNSSESQALRKDLDEQSFSRARGNIMGVQLGRVVYRIV